MTTTDLYRHDDVKIRRDLASQWGNKNDTSSEEESSSEEASSEEEASREEGSRKAEEEVDRTDFAFLREEIILRGQMRFE